MVRHLVNSNLPKRDLSPRRVAPLRFPPGAHRYLAPPAGGEVQRHRLVLLIGMKIHNGTDIYLHIFKLKKKIV